MNCVALIKKKKKYKQINIDFFVYKVEILNCFPAADITL